MQAKAADTKEADAPASLLPAQSPSEVTSSQPVPISASFMRMAPHPHDESKLLYLCTGQDGNQCVVNYTTRYCCELHERLAEEGVAPQLLGYAQLPGGWHRVTMEFLGSSWTGFEALMLKEGDAQKIMAASKTQSWQRLTACINCQAAPGFGAMPGPPTFWCSGTPCGAVLALRICR